MIRTIVMQCDIWPKFSLQNSIRFTFKSHAKALRKNKMKKQRTNEMKRTENRRGKKKNQVREIHFAYINSEHYKFCMIDLMKNLRLIAARTPRHTRTPYKRRRWRKTNCFYASITCIIDKNFKNRLKGKVKH